MTDLAELTLFRATREQTLECSKRTFTQWGRGLTFEQFLVRDTFLMSSAHARDGKLVTWVLAPRNDPTTLDFLCSCDTYRRTIALSSPPGDAIGYGIASVFTPPQNRGKGYARHMMRLLHWVLAPPHALPAFPSEWGAPPDKEVALGDAVLSVLYSDVGREFYKSVGPAPGVLGWVVESPKSTVWNVHPSTTSAAPTPEEKAQWKYLSREDCDAVWERDAQLIREEVGKAGKLAFAFLPDAGVAATRVVRLVQFTPALEPVHPAGPWGVQLLPASSNLSAEDLEYATWTTEPGETTNPKTLVLTRVRASPASFPTLFAAICAHAQQEGYTTIEGWNVPDALAAVGGGRTFERDDRLDAIKWYTKDEGAWLFNEQFCSL